MFTLFLINLETYNGDLPRPESLIKVLVLDSPRVPIPERVF